MNKPLELEVTFTSTTSTKAKKTWRCALTESKSLDGCSPALQAMIASAIKLWDGFTLEELATDAVLHGLETKTTDMHALGYTHRPKLMELGIITDAPWPKAEEEETEELPEDVKGELAALAEFEPQPEDTEV